jgi:hypothetical protein
MIYAIEIESKDECPARLIQYGHVKDSVDKCFMDYCRYTVDQCLGLESPDCPMNRIRCVTCGNGYCERQLEQRHGEYRFHPLTGIGFCGSWIPKQVKTYEK